MEAIESYKRLLDIAAKEKAVLFYFSSPSCGVCKSVKPKVMALVEKHFPLMPMYYVDIEAVPEASGQLSIFSIPAVLVYFEGRETIREARNFGLMELGAKIDRYYGMIFGER
ncbi:MAG TPA: thioredoxin family protein [Rectinemataceae bacterium]|nr:thioredoxin family protein [Rectinemataceae bacterium]